MSNIVGTYTNSGLNAALQIATANDSNGQITGTLSVGSVRLAITGVWNASTVAPNGVLCFTGSTQTPSSMQVGGAAQTDDCNVFSSISLGFAVVQKGTPAMSVCGRFVRS
jgi:hypothetical protein